MSLIITNIPYQVLLFAESLLELLKGTRLTLDRIILWSIGYGITCSNEDSLQKKNFRLRLIYLLSFVDICM